MALRIGDKAPDFSLYSSEKELVHLHDYIGKNVVLLFFPLAFTSTCTKELCATRDDMTLFNDVGAEILAISVDSPQTLAKYKEVYQLNFRLLSDFNKDVSRAYDVLYEEFILGMRGVSKRAVFVLDKEGMIRHMEVLEVSGQMPDMQLMKETVKSLKAV